MHDDNTNCYIVSIFQDVKSLVIMQPTTLSPLQLQLLNSVIKPCDFFFQIIPKDFRAAISKN